MGRPCWPTLCLGAPAVIMTCLLAGMMGLAVIGEHPLWPATPLNMSEAAALRDSATVLQLLRQGERVDRPWRIPAGVLLDHEVTLTPLDAAVIARRPEIVQVLLSSVTDLD